MDFTIASVADAGDDVLLVTATALDAEEREHTFTATGWVSATTNHYDADAYDDDGNRRADATARAMTPAEVGAYARALVLEQNPELVPEEAAPAPTPLVFSDPVAAGVQ